MQAKDIVIAASKIVEHTGAGYDHADKQLARLVAELAAVVHDMVIVADVEPTAPAAPPLTLEKMAELADVSPHWLRGECIAGRMPHAKVGKGKYRFNPAAVNANLLARAAIVPTYSAFKEFHRVTNDAAPPRPVDPTFRPDSLGPGRPPEL